MSPNANNEEKSDSHKTKLGARSALEVGAAVFTFTYLRLRTSQIIQVSNFQGDFYSEYINNNNKKICIIFGWFSSLYYFQLNSSNKKKSIREAYPVPTHKFVFTFKLY